MGSKAPAGLQQGSSRAQAGTESGPSLVKMFFMLMAYHDEIYLYLHNLHNEVSHNEVYLNTSNSCYDLLNYHILILLRLFKMCSKSFKTCHIFFCDTILFS